jgi:hypothetical protein
MQTNAALNISLKNSIKFPGDVTAVKNDELILSQGHLCLLSRFQLKTTTTDKALVLVGLMPRSLPHLIGKDCHVQQPVLPRMAIKTIERIWDNAALGTVVRLWAGNYSQNHLSFEMEGPGHPSLVRLFKLPNK